MARDPVLLRLRDAPLFCGVCVFGCGAGGGEYHITGRLEPWVWSSGTQVLASVLWAEAKWSLRHWSVLQILGLLSAPANDDDSFLWAFVSFQRCSQLSWEAKQSPEAQTGSGVWALSEGSSWVNGKLRGLCLPPSHPLNKQCTEPGSGLDEQTLTSVFTLGFRSLRLFAKHVLFLSLASTCSLCE